VSRLIEYSLVVTTNNYNTLKITVIITHVKSHAKSSQAHFQFFFYYELLVAMSYRQLTLNFFGSKFQVILRPTVSRSVCLGIKHPSGAYDQIFVTVRHLRVSSCGALSLTRGRVCRLQLLLVLASAVIIGSESLGTRNHILLSQIRDFPFRRRLRVAGSRWRYSTPPSHGLISSVILGISLYSCGTGHTANTVLPLRGADHTENTSHVITSQPNHLRADCCLATSCNIRTL
jgi:hypothetical protein